MPTCKRNLMLRCSIMQRHQSHTLRDVRKLRRGRKSADTNKPATKKKRPAQKAERLVWREATRCYPLATAFSTTILRHGLSTAMASSDARMLAPAAMMNTLSQLPDDCCM